ncbi:MAG: aldehyde ferredoxin oxidoreductase family protein [Dehalococcoidales bacterium]|nr:aldehyde ferredoxin oxidoreductase family protein [Dehalococcoidales bacterium]
MGGYKNRILRVDLTQGVFSEESLSPELIHDYIGGRGFGTRLLYDDLKAGTDPLSPGNEIIYMAGPLAGTNAQSFARWKIYFKSPLTGTIFKSSGGGHFASELKFAGFDGVAIKGSAPKPVYIWIHDGKYELRDATYLWGLDCDDTHLLIREELGDPRIRLVCVGPAGERGVKVAGVFSDRRAAARGGGGAVMGMKNLKAIAVRSSSREIEIADPEGFRKAVKEQVDSFRANPSYEARREVGTRHTEFTNLLGMFPTHNFQDGTLPDWEKIDSPEWNNLTYQHTACFGCILRCGAITKTNKGKYAGSWTEGPEYETIWGFSGPMGVVDSGLIIAADNLCDRLGLDTISVASSIGFAYELFERGIINREDTGGMELAYGSDQYVLELVRQIAYREGFGNVLAEGTVGAARQIGKGAIDYAIQVKGLELPAYDPRGAKAHGLNLLTSNNGADHCSGYAPQEMFGLPIPYKADRFATENKGTLAKWNQDKQAMMETGTLCVFATNMMSPEMYAKLISTATGVKDFADPAYLWKVGERIFNLERMFNVREGFNKKDDVFPKRITTETMPHGTAAGQVFETDILLPDYYKARGWDDNGIPTREKLGELGLDFTLK